MISGGGGEWAAEPSFYIDPVTRKVRQFVTNPPITSCPCYPSCSPGAWAGQGTPVPHLKVSDTHCVRCELQAKYPNMFDVYGHPIPAVPSAYNPLTGPPMYTPAGLPASLIQQPLETVIPDIPVPGFISARGTYKVEKLNTDWHEIAEDKTEGEYHEPCEYKDANLVGSATHLEEDGHLPCIDLDLPAHLEPSTKPDHYHLYLNKVVPWDKYVNLLKAMFEAGLVNEGFYEMSVRRGQSYVRRPGVFKKPGEDDS